MIPDLTDFAEDELLDVIAAARRRLDALREDRHREAATGPSGSVGQDVRDPAHGSIAAPTPNEVEEDGRSHGVDFKSRDLHAGRTPDHVGQTHIEKDALEGAARAVDQGPNFGTPGTPPAADPRSIAEIEQAYDDVVTEKNVPRSG